jgi:acylpyruvate hydrolase
MKLATVRTPDGTRAAVVIDDSAVLLPAADVGALLHDPNWRGLAAHTAGPRIPVTDCSFAPVVPHPGKIVCVGLNYQSHILEMGRELPTYPTLFAKYPEALIGAQDPIVLDPASSAIDWEAELAIVVGTSVRRAGDAEAHDAIAGFSILNDVTMRDWQYRSPQWLQGKTFEGSTPFGPYLVTPDELPGGTRPALGIRCSVDGETVQSSDTSDLVFDPIALIRYVSSILTLRPGDVIATGTPGGVGHARKPPRYLTDGALLVTEIAGLGTLCNPARAAVPA